MLRLLLLAFLIFLSGFTYADEPTPTALVKASQSLLQLSQAAERAGHRADAIRFADQAIIADRQSVAGYELRGELLDRNRDFAKAINDYSKVIELEPNAESAWQRRGEDQFRLGHFKESVADFDKVISLRPGASPHHWQRGISLYYAGEFDKGAKQFELHRTVNPQDVENAVWHFLCVARLSGVEKARAVLIPIQDDWRVPMMQVHGLFAGKLKAEDVEKATTQGNPEPMELRGRQFYSHLYLGLYFEAIGDAKLARQHIADAEKLAGDDYMGDVARVHAKVLAVKP